MKVSMIRRSSRKPRIGVAGLGRTGWQFHCKTIGGHQDWQLVAVADPAEERCKEAEQVHGCKSFRCFEEMLKQADLDAVTIATPTHLHRQHALAAIRRGLHLMLEKPMAPSLADARAIRTGGEPFVPAEQTLEVMRIMEWCRKESRRITQTPLA